MQQIIIRPVEKNDLTLLDTALRALSKDLGDTHLASIEFLEQAGFGPTPAYYALIALKAPDALTAPNTPNNTPNNTLCGTIVYSPVMSTTLAASGLYVSDLWVAAPARGCGLGRRLLAHAAEDAHTRWGANYLKLAVYDGSTDARRFYNQLGLTERSGESTMFLDGAALDALKRQR